MKNKFKLLVYYAVVFGLIFTTSCNSTEDADIGTLQAIEGINELDVESSDISFDYNKIVQAFDESGESSVTLNIGSNNQEVLTSILEVMTFKISTLHGDLKNTEVQNSSERNQFESNISDELVGDISVRIIELNLSEKAVGFRLNVEFDQSKLADNRLASYSWTVDYDSPDNWMYWGRVDHEIITNQNSDIQVNWYYRTCSLCSMSYDYSVTLFGGGTSIYNKSGARRIRAKIRSNWYNYDVFFRKWENDPWRQTY